MTTPIYILDDRYEVTTQPHEMRMSLWVYAPVIVERATQRVVLDLSGSLWDLRRVAEGEERIILTLACYPEGGREYVIEVDPVESTVIVQGAPHALAHIETALSAIA